MAVMPRPVAAALAVLVSLAALAAGCAPTLKQPAPERHSFAIETTRPPTAECRFKDTVLTVEQLSISPRYGSRELVYRTGDLAWTSDYYNVWFVQPGAMLTDETREWLERSGTFCTVTGTATQLMPTHTLDGNITALYGDFSSRSAPKAVLEMQFVLLREAGGDLKILHQRTYSRTVPIESATPQALVRGLSTAAGQILAELVRDIEALGIPASTPQDKTQKDMP